MTFPEIPEGTVCKKQAAADIMESIALIEAAISHIVNAEGEKIQAVVGTGENSKVVACSIKELLDTNDSVESILNSVITLESILQKKLTIVCTKCCSKEEHKPRMSKDKYCQDY